MAYAFSRHASAMPLRASVDGDSRQTIRRFALIDVAALKDRQSNDLRLLPQAPTAYLFEESFAHAAMGLSPQLIELSTSEESFNKQVKALDRVCHHLNVMAILLTDKTLTELTTHLRSLLLVKATSNSYLLRFADTQMLAAVNVALTPMQRASFFDGIEAWISIDHKGAVRNAVDMSQEGRKMQLDELPLQFDDEQTDRLLEGVAVPALASQIRNLDPAFAEQLTHAEQTCFAEGCLNLALKSGVDLDADLISLALERWQNKSAS